MHGCSDVHRFAEMEKSSSTKGPFENAVSRTLHVHAKDKRVQHLKPRERCETLEAIFRLLSVCAVVVMRAAILISNVW